MKYDIIICGFGTAGAMAAISAGRMGVSVLVLERTTYPGGLQTGGLITEYCNQDAEGLAAEMEAECQILIKKGDYATCIEAKKYVLEKNTVNAGVDIHYDVVIRDVIIEDSAVCGIIWHECGVEHRAQSKIVIDATAEAVICQLAGCEFQNGRDSDGMHQHSSVIFEFYKEKSFYGYSGTSIRINQENVREFSNASIAADAEIIKQNNADMRLVAPSDRAGIREGRHIVPEKTYVMNDFILSGNSACEPVAYAYSQFDTNITDVMFESESFQDWMIAACQWGVKIWLAIPRETLFPKNKKGLMVAGRHLGIDHDTGHALRMNAAMSCIGEAAGKIAVAALSRKIHPNELPYSEFKDLFELGDSPLSKNECIWGLNEEDVLNGLATETPGAAIWSAYRQCKSELLKKCLKEAEPSSLIFCHALFALALLRDTQVIPFLRDIVQDRDNRLQRSKAFDFGMGAPAISVPHGCIAIYLLGRFRDSGAVDIFEEILKNTNMEYQDEYHSYVIAALLKIGDDHPETRTRIAALLQSRVIDTDKMTMLRFIKFAPELYDAAPHFKKIIEDKLGQWKQYRNGEEQYAFIEKCF